MSILDNSDTLIKKSNIQKGLKRKDGWQKIWWGSPRHKKDPEYWVWEKFISSDSDPMGWDSKNYNGYICADYFPSTFEGYVNFTGLKNKDIKEFSGALKNRLYIEIRSWGNYFRKIYEVSCPMDIEMIISKYIKLCETKEIEDEDIF